MILLAIILFLLGHFIPVWILKNQMNDAANRLRYKYMFLILSGTATCFFVALIIVTTVTLSTPEKYLLNRNAIYGVKCSPTMDSIGFKNGDRIKSINSKEIERFENIIPEILLGNGDAAVEVSRGDSDTIIKISEKDKLKMIHSSHDHFIPIENPENPSLSVENIKYSESGQNIFDALTHYRLYVRHTFKLFFPGKSEFQNIGGFTTISGAKDFKGILLILSLSLLIVGIVNLLPIPGLEMGNLIIAFIEKVGKKEFDNKKLRVVKISCLAVFMISVILILFV